MKKLVALILFLLTVAAQAASPVIPAFSSIVSRESGVIPLCVTFDGSGVTDTDITGSEFGGLAYTWSFGDASAGTYTNGALPGTSKNRATGPQAAHCYTVAGSYTVTLVVSDGTNVTKRTGTITASAFSGTTWCISNAGGDASCGGTAKTYSDWSLAVSECLAVGAPVRCLFKKGDTFTRSSAAEFDIAGVVRVGAYGTGAAPIIASSSTGTTGILIPALASIDDLVIEGLIINGVDVSDTGHCSSHGASASNVSYISMVCGTTIGGLVLSGGSNPSTWTNCTNCVVTGTVSNNGLFFRGIKSVLVDSVFGPARVINEHSARIQRCQKCGIVGNTFNSPVDSGKAGLTSRSDVHSTTAEDSFYNLYSGNKFVGNSTNTQMIKVEPSAGTEDARQYDYVFEKNYLLSGSAATIASQFTATGNAFIRNNIVDLTAATGAKTGILIERKGGPTDPVANDITAVNNTIYSSEGGTNVTGLSVGASSTNIALINNLTYFVGGSGTIAGIVNSGPSTTRTTNTTDTPPGQTVTVDPFIATPTSNLTTFQPSTAYADDGGTASFPATGLFGDFFGCHDKTAAVRIGAIVPRASAICVGAP